MARIGTTHRQSQIYNHALKRYEREFELEQIGNKVPPSSGLTARQRVSEAPTNQQIIFGSYDNPRFRLEDTNKYFKAKEKRDDEPITDYQRKIGSRSTGSFMQMAANKPYIELGGRALNGDLYSVAPSTDLLSDKEMYQLMTVYKPGMVKEKTKEDAIIEDMAKVGQPYEQDKLSVMNSNSRDFIENNLYKTELYPSRETNKGDNGNNLVFDYQKEMNKGTQPMSRQQLYNQIFNSRKSTSNVNTIQREVAKQKEVLSVYGNKQHELKATTKPDVRPEIIKGKAKEQKQQDKIEKKEQGIQTSDSSSMVNMVMNTVSKGAGAASNIYTLLPQ
jgi:hypothetical protein